MDAVQLVCLGVELGQAVAGTVHHAEQLGKGKDEVDDLGDEKKHHSLAEVAQDAHHCEGLPREVAERVANEHL